MKRLYVLRHAQTVPFSSQGDKERALLPIGHEQASALGIAMKEKGYVPDYVLCSPARRTRETFNGLLKALGDVPAVFPEDLYNASVAVHLTRLSEVNERYQSVLVIAHNPGIHELAMRFADDGPQVPQISSGYPPATLSVLDLDCTVWAEIEIPGHSGRLADVVPAA